MIVVDTHIIIWDALEPMALSSNAQQAIDQANQEGGIIFCEISLWEIAMLMNRGRVQVNTDCQTFIKRLFQLNRYILRGITPEIAELATRFPADVNQDPADRIIAATTIVERAVLVTKDRNLRLAQSIPTLW